MKDLMRKIKRASLFVLIMVMVVCALPMQAKAETVEGMTIYGMYLNTDTKGDSVLIHSANEYILMDLGMYDNVPLICEQLDALGVTHFKLYLSHLHLDHVGGKKGSFMAGLNYLRTHGYKIDYLYLPDPALTPDSDSYGSKYETLRAYMKKYMGGEDRITYLKKGSEFMVGYATLTVLGPSLEYANSIHPDDYASKVPDSEAESESGQSVRMTYYENNCSLVTRVACDGVSYLTSGDMLKVEADYLVKEYGSKLKSDICQLSHHGTALGNTKKIMEAINPTYSFAVNNGSTSYDYELRQWAFNRSLTTAKPVSMPYYVANEKKTIAYEVAGGSISLYQGDALNDMQKVEGWISVYGADGINRTKDYYYIGGEGVPLVGVQEIEGNKYYYTETGCMDYGTYDEYGAYLGWKEYGEWKHRYFRLEDDGTAVMLTGFQTIDGKLYYFDENGWKEEGGDELDFLMIGENTYLVDDDGVFATSLPYEFEGKQYYFCETGEMAVDRIVTIGDDSYYYGKYGTRQYSLLVEKDGNTYYFDEEGKMIKDQDLLMDGKEYYFDPEGIMACKRMVERDGHFYYYGKYATRVTDQIVKIDGVSYYFNEEGIMVTDQMLNVGTNTYYFDEQGAMVCKQFVAGEDGHLYYFGKKGTKVTDQIVKVDADRYYVDADGAMVTDQMVAVGDKTYYFDSEGKMVYNRFVADANKNQRYFGKKGTMAKSQTVKVDADRYYVDANGIMVKNRIVTIGETKRYFDKKGKMVTDKIVKVDEDKYYFDKAGVMAKKLLKTVGKKTYYFGKNGKMVKSKTVKINGQKYAFDENGAGTPVVQKPVDTEAQKEQKKQEEQDTGLVRLQPV